MELEALWAQTLQGEERILSGRLFNVVSKFEGRGGIPKLFRYYTVIIWHEHIAYMRGNFT